MMPVFILLGVIVVALIVLTILYLIKRKKEKAAAAAAAAGEEVSAPGGDDVSVLIHEAESKLSAAKLGQAAKIANLPVFLLMGDSGSTKTSVMLHSGLEPELVAGQVFQAGNVGPTRTANFWFSRRAIFAEAGGPLCADPGRWSRLVKRLQPRASVVGKGEQAPRAAVVCFDAETFTRQGAADLAVNAARTLRARLGEMSQAMGINLPVYVLFTKTDRLPFFTEYVRNLSNEESTQVVGVTLPMLDKKQTEGVYGEQETSRLTWQFERLFHALADARPEFLARENDPTKLPPGYEFPREFRKIRPAVVQFLVDLCRPSQLTVGPFLRGFYFTGVRPVVINEAAPVAPAAPQQASYGAGAGATGIFSAPVHTPQPAAAQAAAPSLSTRKVPQWLFLSHLFNDVLLADRAAMGASGSSTKTSGARRLLFIAASALCFLLLVCFTISFFKNHGLESQVQDAARAIATAGSPGADLASVDSLQKLETLRQSVETLGKYKRDGAPLFYRFFLFVGDDLYPEARRVYFDRFKLLMFGSTQSRVLEYLRGLPATPGPEYSPTYDALKAYLITTSHHDKSTKLFLPPVLMKWWLNNRTPENDRIQLAQKQFDFYSEELKEANPYSSENDTFSVEKARRYLKQFAGTERVYAFMLAEADKAGTPVNFNKQFPGSAQVVVDTHEVRGAFTKGGWNFMKDAIAHADHYFSGEQWVLGDQGAGNIDRAKLEQDLKARYYGDFVKEWRAYVRSASVVKYASIKDAADKLGTLSGNQSPLLILFSLASQNTAVDDAKLAGIFQPVQTVVPPQNKDIYMAPSNQNYMNALVQLQASLEGISNQPEPNDAAAAQTLTQATQAKITTRQMAQAFRIDTEGHIEGQTQKLLEDPITNVEALLRKMGPDELNGKGKALCTQVQSTFGKYPFNRGAKVEVTLPELITVFKPKDGAIWQFVDQNLQKYVTKQGAQYVAGPAGAVQINPAFLNWLNRSAAFADFLFAGGAEPHFTYQVKPEPSPDMENIKLTIDGQTQQLPLNAPAPKQFNWPGTPHGTQITARLQGGKEYDIGPYEGLWSVFRYIDDADQQVGQMVSMTLRTGKSGQVVKASATGQPITVKLDFIANPNVFEKTHFAGFGCVAQVAK